MRKITVEERRARLGTRHHLALPTDSTVTVASDMVGLHSSDPATVFLSARARVTSFQVPDLETSLYEDRSLVRVLGMRRTLWVVPTETTAQIHNSSTVKIAGPELKRLEQMVETAGVADNGADWYRRVSEKTLEAIRARGEGVAAVELTKVVPELRKQFIFHKADGSNAGRAGASTRVLFALASEGRVIRGRPRGSWVSGQYRWATVEAWLGHPIPELPRDLAQAELLGRWLLAFGPATETDIAWWTGWTRTDVRAALAKSGAIEVGTDIGPAYLLADDLDPVSPPAPWVALLPSLDPTTMGWKERGWYLGDHGSRVFDRNGNAGPTIWWAGRIVGGWSQGLGGEVVYRLLEDIGSEATAAVEQEMEALQRWLGGTTVTARFRAPLDRLLAGSEAF
ncbi:MAG TPA: winged helix DNA-binding domain-containing protein [Acidimicrobiia bacterium]|nr:winged helix DNA-binding domain-containing protein [Acidimicrobiia bacterium]